MMATITVVMHLLYRLCPAACHGSEGMALELNIAHFIFAAPVAIKSASQFDFNVLTIISKV